MTVRAEAREEVTGGGEDGGVRRGRLDSPWLFVVAIGVLLLIFGEQFIRDPSLTAPTRDPAWYTWRAGIIVHSNPGLVPQDWGPFHMFGGGYRVSVPLIGALLQDIAGTDQSSFAAFMMIFVPILAGLAFGAGAYRSTKSPTLYLLTMFVTGVFFLTTPPDELELVMRWFRIPRDIVFAFVTAVRFVPVLMLDALQIMDAQKSRGLELQKGNIISRLRRFIPILIPLVVDAVIRSGELAEAMESRAYGAVKKPTSLYILSMRSADTVVAASSVLLTGLAAYLFLTLL